MTTFEEIRDNRRTNIFDDLVVQFVHRLENCKVSADVNHPIQPTVCKDTAEFLKGIIVALHEYGDVYEAEWKAIANAQPQGDAKDER